MVQGLAESRLDHVANDVVSYIHFFHGQIWGTWVHWELYCSGTLGQCDPAYGTYHTQPHENGISQKTG